MIYINLEGEKAKLSDKNDPKAQSRWDWKSHTEVSYLAERLSESEGKLYIATDAGVDVSPRFDIIEAPQIGDEVSYSFNGDTYPCGKIVKISKSLRVVETDDGTRFYRRKNSGCWLYNRTWAMVHGHIHEQNPHF